MQNFVPHVFVQLRVTMRDTTFNAYDCVELYKYTPQIYITEVCKLIVPLPFRIYLKRYIWQIGRVEMCYGQIAFLWIETCHWKKKKRFSGQVRQGSLFLFRGLNLYSKTFFGNLLPIALLIKNFEFKIIPCNLFRLSPDPLLYVCKRQCNGRKAHWIEHWIADTLSNR